MLRALPLPVRIALEMASHEEGERRVLAGEMKSLEAEWRPSEETAAIADGLLTAPGVEEWIRRHRPPGAGA